MLYPLSYGGRPGRPGLGNSSKLRRARSPPYPVAVRTLRRLATLLVWLLLTGCVAQAPPAPAVLRDTPPPWPAPRDGVSYFEAAGVASSRLDDTTDQRVFTLTLAIDGEPVPLVPGIGLDLPRALQAPVHTHDETGVVWLEGRGAREVTLGQFFTIWGVRFSRDCLGAACGTLTVTADGRPVSDPAGLRLSEVQDLLAVAVVASG